MASDFDLLIIGGGINGTAIARDAAGRGLKVMLCERDDLASHTSSSSTKLIHGGLRYLEYFEFRLVREALIEREVLLRSAPHIIRPMRFVLPYDEGLRPAWMLRLGLFLYDSLGGRKQLPGTRTISLTKPPHAGVLESRLTKGFEYSDCWVEDARLVVLNAMDAREKGAQVLTHANVVSVAPTQKGYRARVEVKGEGERTITAKAIVNSTGPWVDEVLLKVKTSEGGAGVRLVKGSHIVTCKLFEGEHAYIFQNKDNRIIFAIPYEDDFTLIGTTDVPYSHSEGPVKISEEEITYLCGAASEYLETDIHPKDVVWTYSGVRPLYDDKSESAAAVTRDYVLDIKTFSDEAPFMSIYGGKITTSRKLADHALEKLAPYFKDVGKEWTHKACLPGGDIPKGDFDDFFEKLSHQYPWVEAGTLRRLARCYGTRISRILGSAKDEKDLGRRFGKGLFEAEVRYLVAEEWVTSPQDVLWRRTKLGIHLTDAEIDEFVCWFTAQGEF